MRIRTYERIGTTVVPPAKPNADPRDRKPGTPLSEEKVLHEEERVRVSPEALKRAEEAKAHHTTIERLRELVQNGMLEINSGEIAEFIVREGEGSAADE